MPYPLKLGEAGDLKPKISGIHSFLRFDHHTGDDSYKKSTQRECLRSERPYPFLLRCSRRIPVARYRPNSALIGGWT